MFTSDLANMFTTELEKCKKKKILSTYSLVKLPVNMLTLYQEYDASSFYS